MALNLHQAQDLTTVLRGISGQEHDEKALMDALLRLRGQAAIRMDVDPQAIAKGTGISAGVALLINDHMERRAVRGHG
jgi:hypothetical protein